MSAFSNRIQTIFDRDHIQNIRPGVLAAVSLGAIAIYLSRGLGGIFAQSPLLVAILIGLLVGNSFGTPEALHPGLTFVVKKILRLSVALVGFRVTVQQVADIGFVPFLIAAAILTGTFIFTYWMAKRFFNVEDEMSYLLAAGCSVCGASAILAVAAVVKPEERHTAVSVMLITLFGTITLLLYPLMFTSGFLPGLSEHTYGIFIGATIYEVAQVVGAGYSVSEIAGNTAVVIKLSKVLMLIPLLIILGLRMRRLHPEKVDEGGGPLLPWFVVWFVVLALVNTLQIVPLAVTDAINQSNLFLLTAVMVAVGLRTPIRQFQQLRWAMQPTIATIIVFIVGASFGYGLVRLATPVLADDTTMAASVYGIQYEYENGRTVPLSDGEFIFHDIGCAKCHTPSLPISENRQVYLYSDLLVHDMGPALDDKVVQGLAEGSEWRTAPLWGLGGRTQYLHDGRATTLHDAIVAHGGEAEIITQRYQALSAAEQEELFTFLNTR